jgi:hypothetical protein
MIISMCFKYPWGQCRVSAGYSHVEATVLGQKSAYSQSLVQHSVTSNHILLYTNTYPATERTLREVVLGMRRGGM